MPVFKQMNSSHVKFYMSIIVHVLPFQHCNLDYGSYTKDLSAITDDLSSIFILDNSPGAYRSYPGKEGQEFSIIHLVTLLL